jgi:hypothetical protein
MTDSLLEPALSLPSLLSTAALLESDDEADGLEQDVDFTPTAKRRDSHANLNEDEEEDILGDDPPSMTLREILLSADTSHFHLLGWLQFLFITRQIFNDAYICFVEEDEEDAVLSGDDTSFVWE